MRFSHYIPAVNRPDLLRQAVDSIEPLWRYAAIIDNSPNGEIGRMDWPVAVIRPSVPLSCAQSMNFMQRLASERGLPAWSYQHADVVAPPGKAEMFLADVAAAVSSGKKWAVIFTSYDLISAYNTAAVAEIGPWDEQFPNPNYHTDTDWFYRAKLLGYDLPGRERPEHRYELIHLEGGSTTGRETAMRLPREAKEGMNEAYYLRKWGGPPGAETFAGAWGITG